MGKPQKQNKLVLVIGGANGERVLTISPNEYKPGRKHVLTPSQTVGGGSSINHACRLLAYGIDVVPIVPVIDDHTGKLIVRTLENAAENGRMAFQFKREWFLKPQGENEKTQFTTILNIGDDRNVFSETGPGLAKSFSSHFTRLISRYKPESVSAVLIGHVYADRELKCDITRRIIETFSATNCKIVANFGSSQYEAGHLAWESSLPNITCFQLDLVEMRRFFDDPAMKVKDILNWFRDRCNVVITLERMGAIAQLRGESDIIFVWPYQLPQNMIVDTTGAGDAFAAGVTSALADKTRVPRNNNRWQQIFERAALWAAYACCHSGGTIDCPNQNDLRIFKTRNSYLAHGVDIFDVNMGERVLRLIDRVYS